MPSMFPRRWLLAFVALAAPLAFSPSIARAEDEPSNPLTDDPEAGAALVNGFSMALAKEGLPKDWTWVESDAAGPDAKALEDAVNAIAKDKGVSTSDDFNVKMVSVACPEGAKVHLAYVDLGAPSQTFVDALKAEGAKKSWSVRTMGTDRHVLVTAGPDAIRAQAEGAATAFAARLVTRSAIGTAEGKWVRKLGLARIALQLDPKSAGANFVFGLVAMRLAAGQGPNADQEPAISHLRSALAKDATNTLSKRDTVFAKGQLGQVLLNGGKPNAEARDFLKEAVAGAADLDKEDAAEAAFFRYNLACAHGRLKEVEEAFTLLTAVLGDGENEATSRLISAFREDEDFTNLKEDPRWKKLLEKYPGEGAGGN